MLNLFIQYITIVTMCALQVSVTVFAYCYCYYYYYYYYRCCCCYCVLSPYLFSLQRYYNLLFIFFILIYVIFSCK